MADRPAPFEQLDFLYVPSRDIAADLAWFAEDLGSRVVFAVEAMGDRVAAIQLSEHPQLVLLAGHLEGSGRCWCTGWPPTATAAATSEPAARPGIGPARWACW